MKAFRIALATFALVLGAGTSLHAQQSPPPPPPAPKPAFDPTGVYELQLSFGGQAMPITLELWKENDAWKGTAGNPSLGSANVVSLTQEGRAIRVNLSTEGISYSMNLTVKEDKTIEGKWEGNGDGSPVTGKKTK